MALNRRRNAEQPNPPSDVRCHASLRAETVLSSVAFQGLSNIRATLRGDLLAFETNKGDARISARVRSEQLSGVARGTPLMMLATCLNALAFLSVVIATESSRLGLIWVAAVMASSCFVLSKRLLVKKPRSSTPSARGLRVATYYAFLQGLLWGLLPALFFSGAAPTDRLIIGLLCIGMMFGASAALWSIPLAMIGYITPVVIGSLYALNTSGVVHAGVISVFLITYTVALFGASVTRASALVRRCVSQLEIENNVLKDELTKLTNRTGFHEELAKALARLDRKAESFAVMCLDLDGFKGVNDTVGHAAGDKVLIEAARRLIGCTRSIDTLARLGGDEFAIIAADINTPTQGKVIAERIVRAFQEPFWIDDCSHLVTISIGLAFAPHDGLDGHALLTNADSALYATKRAGRSGFTLFRERFTFVADRATLEMELDRALAQNELYIVFQPFVDVFSRRATGFEALLRWRHPINGELSAREFIPLLERGGLIDAVDSFVIKEAVAAASAWPGHLRLAVNVSPMQLRKAGFAQTVIQTLQVAGFDPQRLELELTQIAIAAESAQAVEELDALRALGVKTTLDHLDASHSSLVNLVALPIDRLKIDERLVAGMGTKPMCASIIKISAEVARAMNIEATAEGVKTSEQLEVLRSLGCTEVQGDLFGKPRPASELDGLYMSSPLLQECV